MPLGATSRIAGRISASQLRSGGGMAFMVPPHAGAGRRTQGACGAIAWRRVRRVVGATTGAVRASMSQRGRKALEITALVGRVGRGRRTARNDAAACHDDPVAAPSLNSQYTPSSWDNVSGRYLLRAVATVNHRNTTLYILDAVISEQRPRVVGLGDLIRGGRFRSRRKRRSFRRGGRDGRGRTYGRNSGSLLQPVEPRRDVSKFRGRRSRDGDILLQFIEPRHDIGKFGGRRSRHGGFLLQFIEPPGNIGKFGGGIRVDALVELIQTRSVLVLDLVKPDHHLRERRAEIARRGALLLAPALARDRLQRRLDEINSRGKTCDRLAFHGGERPVSWRNISSRRHEDPK